MRQGIVHLQSLRMPRVYLDNAATSFPKPPCVTEAMVDFCTRIGASPGRSHYAESREASAVLRKCRERLCRLINGESPDNIVFTHNTTDALNLAIKGIVRQRRHTHPGRPIHLVASEVEHNSILRPLRSLREDGDVSSTLVDIDPRDGRLSPASVCHAITTDTALVVLSHAGNVTGTLQPVREIAGVCREAGVLFLLDAAQSIGHVPIDVQSLGIDFMAFPGHKGLLGPQGTGGLYIRPGVERLISTTREGGTGQSSESDQQPSELPGRLESGTPNTPGIAGLSAAAAYLLDRGVESVRAHELELMEFLVRELSSDGCRMAGVESRGPLDGLRLLGTSDVHQRVGVFSFTHESLSPIEMVNLLECRYGILARAGHHCASRAHRAMGVDDTQERRGEGSFRVSFGPFTTKVDVHGLLSALRIICTGLSEPTIVYGGSVTEVL